MCTSASNRAAETQLVQALLPGMIVSDIQVTPELVTLIASPVAPTASCPRCATVSGRVHSYYSRRPSDLPITGRAVRLLLSVRRFRCVNTACPTATFAERLPQLVAPSAQRTLRLNSALGDLAFALGGGAGARQSKRQAIGASPDTLLRRIRSSSLPSRPTPQVLGVDDFALRKGHVYGTILTNGETHDVVDLLPDRTSATLARWLKEHPGVAVITRDRSTEYARGASEGAPEALQIADRWHLLGNLREALERMLERLRPQLQKTVTASALTDAQVRPSSVTDRDTRRGTKDQVRQQANRAKRHARFAQVKRLQSLGRAIIQIARELCLSRQTVRKYMASDTFPEVARPKARKSILDPFAQFLQERWDAGCHDNKQLLDALREQGYGGSVRPIVQWTMLRRPFLPNYRPPPGRRPVREVKVFVPPEQKTKSDTSASALLPAPRRLVWPLMHVEERLDDEAKRTRDQLLQEAEVVQAHQLTQQFRAMVRDRAAGKVEEWIAACRASSISELVSFADGLERELSVIKAALERSESNGLTEGPVNRLKMLKRTMYGRASFELLRQRVLGPN